MAFTAGQKLRVSDLAGASTVIGGGAVFMGADVTANNTTTFTDATGLSVPVVAGATYKLSGWLRYTCTSTPDLKIQPSSPSGTSGNWSLIGWGRDVSPAIDAGAGAAFAGADIGTSLTVAGDSTGTLSMVALVHGLFIVTTAGTFKLRMAQRTANASNTILRAGSWINVERMA